MAPKVLVVDDDPKLLRIVSLSLSQRGYQVSTTQSGDEAIRHVEQDRPDIIIADINMPGMDGYELCRRLRRNDVLKTIPFIFLTGRDQDADRIRARKVGADDYLTKPCPLEHLAQSVETTIDRIEQAKSLSLDQIGLSGHIEEIDLLDMIQTLELNQQTGALVLSHGERTGTIYFRQGVIVDADIRSPKREEPLFVLLGWKTGRYLFIPDAVPERMAITTSMANLLFQDFRMMEERDRAGQRLGLERAAVDSQGDASGEGTITPRGPSASDETGLEETGGTAETGSIAERLLPRLGQMAQRQRRSSGNKNQTEVLRLLVIGVAGAGTSDLIHLLVKDLSVSRWAVIGTEPGVSSGSEFGRVWVSPETVLHLVAVRGEKRFRSLWEQVLSDSVGAILLMTPSLSRVFEHARTFLKAKESLAPHLPLHVLFSTHLAGGLDSEEPSAGSTGSNGLDQDSIANKLGIPASRMTIGSIHDPAVRLQILEEALGPEKASG